MAIEAHSGQTRWNGAPYVSHPMRVGAMVADLGDLAVGAALLHDVIEDTPYFLEDLSNLGFPETLVSTIDALTNRPGEPYLAFIHRIKRTPRARPIKLADIADNLMDLSDGPRRSKYLEAQRILVS